MNKHKPIAKRVQKSTYKSTPKSAQKRVTARKTSKIQKHHIYGFIIISIALGGLVAATNAVWFNNGKIVPVHAVTGVPVVGSASAPANYGLVWNDEFNSTSVDATKWNVLNNANYGSGSNEDQCYYRDNVQVSGGVARLTAKKQTVTCGGTNPDTGTPTYYVTSGFMTTRAQGGVEKFAFKKGYVEASIKLPKGNPYWGAFWLVGGAGAPGWPQYGEMDVMEQNGTNPDTIIQTFHYACGAGNCNTGSSNNYNLATGSTLSGASSKGTYLTASNFSSYSGITTSRFVRYGMLWEDSRITWYVDGKPTRSFDGTNVITYTSNSAGAVITSSVAKTVSGSTAVSPSASTVFAYPHTIILNLAYGGSVPKGGGYTGGETATGYNDGNTVATQPGVMEIDYIRTYQLGTGVTTPVPAPAPAPAPAPDTIKPTVTATTPLNDAATEGTTVFNVTASDNVGVANVKLYIDGYLRTTDTSAPYETLFDTTKLGRGTHSYYFIAADTSGNTATTAKVVFTVNNTESEKPAVNGSVQNTPAFTEAPVVMINPGSVAPATPIKIPKGSVIEVSGVSPNSAVTVKVDGEESSPTIDTTKLVNGTHTIDITENDTTTAHEITVSNPWHVNVANNVKEYPVLYGGMTLGGLGVTGFSALALTGRGGWLLKLFRL